MRRVEAEALVGASRDEVWALFDDIAGTPRWMPLVREVVYVSGPAHVGTVYRQRTRLRGLRDTGQWEITEHRRPIRQVHVAVGGGLESRLIITFEGRGTGTWVHEAMELRSGVRGPVGWVHEVIASFVAGVTVRSSVAAAKRAFEGEPPR
jgi:hypothetical protein